jgi:glycosyltransferase involved in cell wall biosynthesis
MGSVEIKDDLRSVRSTAFKAVESAEVPRTPATMPVQPDAVRVLYSFPHKLGAARICTTAWQQVRGIAAAGADVTVFTGCLSRALTASVRVRTTLAWKKLRLPYKLLGSRRACALHDWLVARKLKHLAGKVDVIHVWPTAALRTIQAAKQLGIPTLLERPNAHTRFAYETVQNECQRLGISMPTHHEHAYNSRVLEREELEYQLTDYLLCPSDFVARTFRDEGFSPAKLMRHQYGYDREQYYPDSGSPEPGPGLKVLFAGGCAPRKGLHYALDAWLQSSACRTGTFQIAGEFIAGYAELLSKQLRHPSVKVLGHRHDLPELMRHSDVLVLPSIEEGSALATYEARGSGCVLLVSDASGAVCRDAEDALVHPVGDVPALTRHLNLLDEDRALLRRMRAASLSTVSEITWEAAGVRLVQIYREAMNRKARTT